MKITHEKAQIVLKWFEEISKIPRCSKNEAAICSWLENWGKTRGFNVRRDKAMNLVIKVPASIGFETAEPVVIQEHMDMVCEKTKDSDHDFTKDPIKCIYEDGWLRADKTTLGADNCIGLAMALTAADEEDVVHPSLELLFTVNEEMGSTVMDKECTRRILDAIMAIPHGVSDMSTEIDGLVETSCNLAAIRMENGEAKIQYDSTHLAGLWFCKAYRKVNFNLN